MPETRRPPRVGNPKIDYLLSVNRLIEAAEDTRRCRDNLLEASTSQTTAPPDRQGVDHE